MDDMPEDPGDMDEDYLEDHDEWVHDEPEHWTTDEDYLEDYDDWLQDAPEHPEEDWTVEDYEDYDDVELAENYSANTGEIE